MLTLFKHNLPVLITALVIGLATARWMFRRPAQPRTSDKSVP